MKKQINNEIIDMTAEEVSQREKDTANGEAERTAQAEAKAQKEAAAKSGNQKLLDLGLTQAEATALTGYTPPEESE